MEIKVALTAAELTQLVKDIMAECERSIRAEDVSDVKAAVNQILENSSIYRKEIKW